MTRLNALMKKENSFENSTSSKNPSMRQRTTPSAQFGIGEFPVSCLLLKAEN